MKFALTMFGAGYVLGTKAGRQRYEQIAGAARRVSQAVEGSYAQTAVQNYVKKLEAYAQHGDSNAGSA